jgi:hypothetical protein
MMLDELQARHCCFVNAPIASTKGILEAINVCSGHGNASQCQICIRGLANSVTKLCNRRVYLIPTKKMISTPIMNTEQGTLAAQCFLTNASDLPSSF